MSDTGARSRLLMISLPALLAVLLLLSALGLAVAGYVGRTASGERVTIAVTSACPVSWQERLDHRAGAIGLGDPVSEQSGDTILLTVTLPGNADDRETLPSLLTAPGLLSLHTEEGQAVADHSDLAESRLSMSYMARTTVALRPSEGAWARIRALDPDAVLFATLDGVTIELGAVGRVGRDDELHVQPSLERAPDEMKMAADWSIVLGSGPAPCAVDHLTVSDAQDS